MKLGFIGAGNMAQSIIDGLLHVHFQAPEEILIHGGHPANYVRYAEKTGVRTTTSNVAVVEAADLIVLAVKPAKLASVAAEIKSALTKRRVPIISLLTGVSIEQIKAALGTSDYPVMRAMPNLNVAINQGITAYATSAAVDSTDHKRMTAVFEALGTVIPLAEKDFAVFVALAGSSPAFVYLFIDALARAGVKYGLKKTQADQIVAQAVLGSGAMVLRGTETPFDLIDRVSSPGGSTVAGLLAMEAEGFIAAVVAGVDATVAKDRQG